MASLAHWLHDKATRRAREYEALLEALARQPEPAASPPEPGAEEGWLMSSLELKYGLRVSEAPLDTLPGELRDALLTARR